RTEEIDGHEGAGREPDRDDALRRWLALASDRVDQRHEVGDLAGAPRLLGRVEPVPAAARVVPLPLRRVEREEPTTLGRPVQARPLREDLGRLPGDAPERGGRAPWVARAVPAAEDRRPSQARRPED